MQASVPVVAVCTMQEKTHAIMYKEKKQTDDLLASPSGAMASDADEMTQPLPSSVAALIS